MDDQIRTYGDDNVSFAVEVRVPYSQANAFAERLTGNDDDIILAAEKAMRSVLDTGGDEFEVELHLGPRMGALKDGLTWAGMVWAGTPKTEEGKDHA